jgi:hypothetical protein
MELLMSFRFSLPKALSFLISLNAFPLTTGSTSGRINGSLSVAGEDCFLLIVRDGGVSPGLADIHQ